MTEDNSPVVNELISLVLATPSFVDFSATHRPAIPPQGTTSNFDVESAGLVPWQTPTVVTGPIADGTVLPFFSEAPVGCNNSLAGAIPGTRPWTLC